MTIPLEDGYHRRLCELALYHNDRTCSVLRSGYELLFLACVDSNISLNLSG
jgi:hypothetical protein